MSFHSHPWRDVRCVLFDLDGTLIDSAADLALAANQMRQARGLDALPLAQYRCHAGTGARGMLAVALQAAPSDPGFASLREEFFARYQECLLHTTRLFDGVAELLAQLHAQGITWGIVTNKSSRFAQPIVESMPELASAGALICGDTTAHTKPHPEPVLEALRRTGSAADKTIYVGDDERDVRAGQAAGVRTVAACYGYLGAGAKPSDWQADALIDQPDALLNLLTTA